MVRYNDRLSQYINELFAAQDELLKFIKEDKLRGSLPAIGI